MREHPPSDLAPSRLDGKPHCPWPGDDPLYLSYHDEEWGVPERDDRALYEKLMLDGFQAGSSSPVCRRCFEAYLGNVRLQHQL